jgi:F-type H+-transporting ATPase subunit b
MLSELSDRQERLIEETRREQAKILKEASEARDKMIADAKEQARDEASKLIEEARTRIAAEKESALRDIRTEVAGLSVDVAEKVLREKLSTDEAQLALIDKMIGEVTASQPN